MNGQLAAERINVLDVLVGDWELVASVAGRPLGLGRISFGWMEGGAFLREHGEAGEPLDATPPEWIANSPFPTTAVIGLDDGSGEFSYLHADARGVRRVYRMTFDGRTWTMRGATENGYQQTFTGAMDAERRTITAKWESSRDGESWNHDFDETYTRVS
jgi:hypothetical protein